jgi:hypothetical protein
LAEEKHRPEQAQPATQPEKQVAGAAHEALEAQQDQAHKERLAGTRSFGAANRDAEPKSSHVQGPARTVTFIGFQQGASVSRVFVRTSGPVPYSIREDGKQQVTLELENASIAPSNRRALDTSQFETAVERVVPSQVPAKRVRLEIALRENVSYQTKQDGNEISVEFRRPSHP